MVCARDEGADSESLKAAVEWKPTGNRPRGRPKKR